ncbi:MULTISPECIES: RNA polymerase sigma factor [unclassified Pedobacter]|uniref:RNA polymerase sigma factor n=1 Tax=Pedobacter TaxID=84567 RepID=UPI000B4AF376|nr:MULTISPECIES: sigma-70 family RNA polymerase sigma factor [unclassified Pedobacter]MCX2433015.1 sigma-70 family RNA polymerase sigma factor [Pedobacter sp. GR22-10]MCX2586410.1 sigma-70 family RNA polymerase sigma factor [Pedobacter sp. MR22-3]OWK72161.1 RNA polymerase subunit sigma-70 [Pedobacter sp. AJM]
MTALKKTTLTEPELVFALQSRDSSVLKTLYGMYSSALYGVISRIITHTELAEDVLQETFVKIWQSAEHYDNSKGRLFTWMMNIARNLSIDKLRSKDFKNSLKNQDIENNVSFVDEQNKVTFNPDVLGIKQLVENLKPDLHAVLDLVYYKGYTHVEAAEKLNLPLGTVKTRIRLAIIELRRNFN